MFDSVGDVEDAAPVIAYAAAGGPTHRGGSGGKMVSAVAVESTANATSRGAACDVATDRVVSIEA